MTAEQFEEAKNLRDDAFAACCELNPDFEVEFYSWVDYYAVLKLQEQHKPTE